jgi:hypothetical protein
VPFIDVNQQTEGDSWLKMRVGAATASRMHDIVAKLKVKSKSGLAGDYKATRRNYLTELITERLTGLSSEHYLTEWMIRGSEDEDLAVAAYEHKCDEEILHGGLFVHDSIEYFMASPDRRVGETGLLEVKNFKPENHYEILRNGIIPEDKIWQLDAQLACAPEREWVDWGSYCKEFLSPKLRLFVRRHHRDAAKIAEVETEMRKFNAELAYELMELANRDDLTGILKASVAKVNEVAEYEGLVP